ncbi:GerAB/ArcD/ProY family transporter [Paenibacillus cremeus]|uniref:GerAB/ArcD/ProY family transporter n=1 Tax=Paenibacillus cremeus TaxID=2163881 RepID=A0A559KG67_9BACL|nr:endospore germination permease [Paenibacillus cremeus]TVY11127.1 GerAB/ArcD/ProY family transporter [Paenibacillus cremeus]
MNRQETISSWQLATLFLAFMTGSAIINIPAPLTGMAKNGAWVSLLLANGIGMLLLGCILYLHRRYPDMTFMDFSRKVLGKWLSVVIGVPFLIYLMLMTTWIVIDIGGFFKSTMLKETPSYMIHSLILLTASLTVRSGIEVMARMFTLLLYSMFFFGIWVVLLASPNYRVEYLLPVFPDGIKPVLHGLYYTFGFPYAEVVIFASLLPFVRKEKNDRLTAYMFAALIISGIALSTAVVCSILAMGPLAGELKYSLFQIARLISVGDIVERIESVIGMSLIAGSYMKATIALYVLNLGLSQLLKLKDDRLLVFPLALISFLHSLIMFKNEAEFAEKVTDVWPLLNAVLSVFPILLITLITFIKSIFAKKSPN